MNIAQLITFSEVNRVCFISNQLLIEVTECSGISTGRMSGMSQVLYRCTS